MIYSLKVPYFDVSLKWILAVALVLLFLWLVFWMQYIFWAFLIVLILIALFGTYYDFSISDNKISDSFYFMFIRTEHTSKEYSRLDKILLKKERHTYSANQRGRTRVADFHEYVAELVYDGKSIEIIRKTDWHDFQSLVSEIEAALKIQVERTF